MAQEAKSEMLEKILHQDGFIAALDQSGGSTPKALSLYGIDESAYSNDGQMYQLVHAMRSRIVTSPSFTGQRILGAILFENTMDSDIVGKPTAKYLWEEKQVIPFLKVDKGLANEQNGVQLMKPMPDLDTLLAKANQKGIFGTKMRSVIKQASEQGIQQIVSQQFDIGKQILAAGLVPIIEPEVDINISDKADAEVILKKALLTELDNLDESQNVMLKLTLPDIDNFYRECIDHERTVRVVALSGGYSREVANQKLAANNGMIASFSRALTEGLSADQSDDEFNTTLDTTIDSICQASRT